MQKAHSKSEYPLPASEQGEAIPRLSRHMPRRAFLAGGLALGGSFFAGALLTGSDLSQQSPAVHRPSGPLVFAMSWQGIDYAWLANSAQVSCATDQGLFVVDWRTGQRIGQQQEHIVSPTPSWSADSTRVAYVTSHGLIVQDTLNGRRLWDGHNTPRSPFIASLSPDGTLLALVSSDAHPSQVVQIWHVPEQRLLSQCAQNNSTLVPIHSLVWSPDSTRVASTGTDGSLHTWHASNGHLLWTYTTQGTARPREVLGWLPGSSSLAFVEGGDKGQTSLGVVDAHSGQTRFRLLANLSYPLAPSLHKQELAWSPDGASLAFVTVNQAAPLLYICSTAHGQRLFTCEPVAGQPTNLAWSPDGRYLAASITRVNPEELAGGDNGDRSIVQFWDAHTGRALFSYTVPKDPNLLRWSPDSRYLALITPRLYDVLPNKTCLSLCRYGYQDYALEIFHVGSSMASSTA